jgi:hypothetical protein
MKIEPLHFRAIERASTAPAENGELVAGFVHCAVTVDALGDGESRAARESRGDKFRNRTRAESGKMGGIIPRGNDLEDAKTISAVG